MKKYILIIVFFSLILRLNSDENCLVRGEVFLKLRRGTDVISGAQIFILDEENIQIVQKAINDHITSLKEDLTKINNKISKLESPIEKLKNNKSKLVMESDLCKKEIEKTDFLIVYIKSQKNEVNRIWHYICRIEGYLRTDLINPMFLPVTLSIKEAPQYRNFIKIRIPKEITSHDRIYLSGTNNDFIEVEGKLVINIEQQNGIKDELTFATGKHEMIDITDYVSMGENTISIVSLTENLPSYGFKGLKLMIFIPINSSNYKDDYLRNFKWNRVPPELGFLYTSPITGETELIINTNVDEKKIMIQSDIEKIKAICLNTLKDNGFDENYLSFSNIISKNIEKNQKYKKISSEIEDYEKKINRLENEKNTLQCAIQDISMKISKLNSGLSYSDIYEAKDNYNYDNTIILSYFSQNAKYKLVANKDGIFTINMKKNNKYVIFIPYESQLEKIYWYETINIKDKDTFDIIFSNHNCNDMDMKKVYY